MTWQLIDQIGHYRLWNYEDLWRTTLTDEPPVGDGGTRQLEVLLLSLPGPHRKLLTENLPSKLRQIVKYEAWQWRAKLQKEKEHGNS